MKILLTAVNAKYIHSNPAVHILKACAGEFADSVFLKEYTINQQMDEVMADLFLEKPDVICVSCYIWNISFVCELFQELSKVLPGTALWAGGPEVSYDAAAFLMRNPFFTGVIRGEGENSFPALCASYLRGEPELSMIRGLTWRSGERILENDSCGLTDLDKVPFIYQDLSAFENRIIYYESSRGCPFRCSYCLSSLDKRLRFRNFALVKKELAFFLDHKVPQVKFTDRTFNCGHSHAAEIWNFLLENDNGVTNFHFEIAADLLTEEELALIEKMRPGLIQLEIGVQSTNPVTLREIRRSMDFEKVRETVSRIREFHNTHQHLDLIAGLPFEDYDSFHRSFTDVFALQPNQLQLGFLKILKGSYMAEMTSEYGMIFLEREPYEVLQTKWLKYEDMLRLKRVESMVELYYNSGQFHNTLSAALPFFEDAFVFFQRLGDYYAESGYQTVSHSRIRRYEILKEFLERNTALQESEIADAMVIDLYLRENLKSRPSFAPDQGRDKDTVHNLRLRYGIPKTDHIEILHSGRALWFQYGCRDILSGNAAVTELVSETEINRRGE